MIYRILGRTGIRVSAVSFGAGPVSGLMTGDDEEARRATVARALEAGINWFDTAPGYGQGISEANLGRVLADLNASQPPYLATKVRLPPDSSIPIAEYIRSSVEESLRRLGVSQVAVLQLHNGITVARGDEPDSITPAEVLGDVAEAFARLKDAGMIRHTGLTGTGDPEALRQVIRSGAFDTLQVPFNILNPSAGSEGMADGETDYGNVMADCASTGMGVFAIRVFAAGALLDQPPSDHTRRTRYFPLPLYERDLERSRRLRERVRSQMPMAEVALRFALGHAAVSSAIIGFGSPGHVDEVARMPLEETLPG